MARRFLNGYATVGSTQRFAVSRPVFKNPRLNAGHRIGERLGRTLRLRRRHAGADKITVGIKSDQEQGRAAALALKFENTRIALRSCWSFRALRPGCSLPTFGALRSLRPRSSLLSLHAPWP